MGKQRQSWQRRRRWKLWPLVALAGLAVPGGAAWGDEPAWRLVEASPLPQGAGLAARLSSEAELARQASVIFADDFEGESPGSAWDETRNPGGAVLQWIDPGTSAIPLGRRCLQVTATLGENTGGGLTKWFASADRLFLRFYVRFDEGCDYVHHFCTLRANRGLSGKDRWSGFGGAGERPRGDERFSTAIEPWGNWGRWPPPGRWNFYSYWHQMQPSGDGKYWGNSFCPDDQPAIERGVWTCVEMMLKHNEPGRDDGEQAFWIDGQLRGHWQGIDWRTDANLQANAFTLESYVTDRWTKQRVNIVAFDNVAIGTEYLGPSVASVPQHER